MPPTPRLVADHPCVLGEGPIWHEDDAALYWLDIMRGLVLRHDPATGRHEVVRDGPVVGAMTIQTDGSLLLLGGGGKVSRWHRGEETTLLEGIDGETRFNDAIADDRGRVYSGTMPRDGWKDDPSLAGRLYRLDPDGSVHVMDKGFGCPNGMGFLDEGKTLLFVDTPNRRVLAYDVDRVTGDLSNRRVHLDTSEQKGAPDGMTLDAEGCLWSARWGGGCVHRFGPGGEHLLSIELPADNVTCPAFGGPGLSTLYLSTAGGDDAADHPPAGALFAVDLDGVRGEPENRSRFQLD